MINSIEYVQSVYTTQKKEAKKPSKAVSTNGQVKVDNFVSKDPKTNIKKAIKDGSLVFTEPTKLFGVVTLREGFYTYYPKNNETIGEIKQKFGIKNNVIKELNGIADDDFCPVQNKVNKIIFRLDD